MKNSVCKACTAAVQIVARHDKPQIQRRRSLRQHADIDTAQRVKHTRRDTGSVADVFTHNADDSLILIHGNFSELAQFSDDRFHALGLIDGERNADFRRRDHVHRGLVAIEYLEDAPHETVRHEHPRGPDVEHHHLTLARNRFDDVPARDRRGLNARALHLRAARVQDHDRDIAVDRRHDSRGMQYLGAKIG